MADVVLKQIKKSYGKVDVIHGVDLDIKQGEFIVFVGPSGCGKSTLLRMIAGLEEISGGEMQIDGVRVNETPPSQRGIAMVFQSYALYPHMTVYENMAFSMRLSKKNKAEIDDRIQSAAKMLQLEPYLSRLPKALSGGQRQRVAIGRAIVRNPKVFLFDEPLSNLDAGLRVATRLEIANLKDKMPDSTMVYVTHDQVEAMTLADRIVVLSNGYIEQVGSPMELYEKPANLFVAKFIGSPAMNIVAAELTKTGSESALNVGQFALTLPIKTPLADENKTISFGVRPEDVELSAESQLGLFEAKVSFVEKLGDVTMLFVDILGSEAEDPFIIKVPGIHDYKKGETVRFNTPASKCYLFGEDGNAY